MWGFTVHVYGHESIAESCLPLFMDHFLGSLSVISDFLEEVYFGVDESEDEVKSAQILRLKFLQECDLSAGEVRSDEQVQVVRVSTKIPEETITKLIKKLNKPLPLFQPKLSALIQPKLLLEMILAAAEKHFNIAIVNVLNADTSTNEEVELLSYIFNKIYGLLRKLQVIGNLENQWEMCIDDYVEGIPTEEDSPFFVSLSEVESSQNEFEYLCQILDVPLPSLESQNILTAINKIQKKLRTEVKIRKGEFSWEEEDLELEKEKEKKLTKDVEVADKDLKSKGEQTSQEDTQTKLPDESETISPEELRAKSLEQSEDSQTQSLDDATKIEPPAPEDSQTKPLADSQDKPPEGSETKPQETSQAAPQEDSQTKPQDDATKIELLLLQRIRRLNLKTIHRINHQKIHQPNHRMFHRVSH